MANLNKVMLIGRLTDKPKLFTFSNGGRVAQMRFAVNNRKKNQDTGQWEDDPVFIDLKAFNRENGRKLADQCEQYLDKGHQVYFEGHLVMESWEDQTTKQKRTAIKVIVEDMQFLEPRSDGAATSRGAVPAARPAPARAAAAPSSAPAYDDEPDLPPSGENESEIPF